MAIRGPEPLPFTLVAGADLSLAQFAPLALSSGKAVLANLPSDVFLGVLGAETKPRANEHAGVVGGPAITKGRCGIAVTRGQYLTVQSGWFIPGNKAIFSAGSWSNAGSLTALAALALETVTSGGVATIKLFENFTLVNTN